MRRTFEERLNIVNQAKFGKPIRELARENHLKEGKVLEWVRKYDRYGESGLKRQPKCGRPVKDMGRAKKKEPQTELEKLQAENARLKAENALLKKVKALFEEQQARAQLNGQQPSKD